MPARLTEKLTAQLEDMRRNVGMSTEDWDKALSSFNEDQRAVIADGFLGRAQNTRQYQEMQTTLQTKEAEMNRKLETELANLATMKNQVQQQLSLRTDNGDAKASAAAEKIQRKLLELGVKYGLPAEDIEFRLDDIVVPQQAQAQTGYAPQQQQLTLEQINNLIAQNRQEVRKEVEGNMSQMFMNVTALREDFFDKWGERLDLPKVQEYMARNNVDAQAAINDIYDIPKRERDKVAKDQEDWRTAERAKIQAEESLKYSTATIGAPNIRPENLPPIFGLLAGQVTETSNTNTRTPVATSHNELVREIAAEAHARGL